MKLSKESIFAKENLLEGFKLAFKSCFFTFALVFIIAGLIIISAPPTQDMNTNFWTLIFQNCFSMYFVPFGLTLALNNITITLIPLGLTLLAMIFSYMSAKQCKELNIYKLLLSFIFQCFFSILISIPNKTISGESVFKIL
ncbi:MAG: hypothetical protein LBB07_01260, partial [Bifidobacteriaceae bacterium]|nr:hypothetical protein [Bifidobacteriaceae bacterium]